MANYTSAAVENGQIAGGVWFGGIVGAIIAPGAPSADIAATRFTGLPISPGITIWRTVTLQVYVQPLSDGTMTVSYDPSTTPAAWSGASPPGSRSEVVLGSAAVSVSAGFVTVPITLDNGILEFYHRGHDEWNGRLALIVKWSGAGFLLMVMSGPLGPPPTLMLDELPEYTGMPGYDKEPERAMRCPRCGRPRLASQLNQDGFTNTPVCFDCYDPPEPRPGPIRPERPSRF